MAVRQASTSAGQAPEVEEAMYNAVLVGVSETRLNVGQFVKDKVNGDPKLEWTFDIKDETGEYVVYPDENSKGEPFEKAGQRIQVSKLTGVGFNIKSKTVPAEVRVLKALLTKAEYAAFEDGDGTPDDAEQAPEGLLGRGAQVEVFVKENGWPGVGNVVAPLGGQKGKDLS